MGDHSNAFDLLPRCRSIWTCGQAAGEDSVLAGSGFRRGGHLSDLNVVTGATEGCQEPLRVDLVDVRQSIVTTDQAGGDRELDRREIGTALQGI